MFSGLKVFLLSGLIGTLFARYKGKKEKTLKGGSDMKWFKVGYLPTSEAVYCNEAGSFAKECDYTYLVGMTKKELGSIQAERT